jgi:hypothetical protein
MKSKVQGPDSKVGVSRKATRFKITDLARTFWSGPQRGVIVTSIGEAAV